MGFGSDAVLDFRAFGHNDLEAAAIRVAPQIATVLKRLSKIAEAKAFGMSGSGATCFALFSDRRSAAATQRSLAAEHPGWWVEGDQASLVDSNSSALQCQIQTENRFALAILAGFAIARLLFAFAIGLGIDESYTIAISRRLSLSYFDHPPLHLWIAHFAALALGENVAVRVVFVSLFFATGWIYYQFVSRLFGPRVSADSAFCAKRYSFLFRLRRGMDRSGWPATFWVGGGGVGCAPTIFPATVRRGFGLAILAACRLRPWVSRTFQVQRDFDRKRIGDLHSARTGAAALA